ncbi:NUDIX hydrolase [Rhizobium sullae]|uniref:NUDIX hydrolase n=1 Tax=Rhizobium sullae TaxID=50338 RepID=UPI0014054B97
MTRIACAAFVRNGFIFLVKRGPHKARYPNHWDLVGGHVELSETIEAALVWEAQEEVGLSPCGLTGSQSFQNCKQPALPAPATMFSR